MSIQAVAWAISQRVGSPTGKALLICLANYANERGECWPSQRTIAHEAELSRRTAITWLNRLETDGFIKRRRRQSKDGFRTSDFVTLQLDKLPEPSEAFDPDDMPYEIQSAESAPRKNLSEPDGQPRCTSRSKNDRQMHSKEPSPKPLKEPSSGARARRTEGFEKLWEEWPKKERPEKLKAAKWAYERLSPDDQARAVKQARRFRRLAKTRKGMPLMIPYLKKRQFEELDGAPELNADGKFIITPERPEWPSWREHLRSKYSDAAVERLDARKSFFADERWPATTL